MILVDEIEKAAPKVGKFVTASTKPKLALPMGRAKSWRPVYVVMTSNLGATEAMQMHDSGETAMKNVLRNKAIKFFGPEMIRRFGALERVWWCLTDSTRRCRTWCATR